MTLSTLLIAASIVLVGFSSAAILVLQADEHHRKVRQRRHLIVAPYTQAEAQVEASARLSIKRPAASLRRRIIIIVGMDPDRREPYAISLYVVVPSASIVGMAIKWLLHGLLGSLSWLLIPLVAWFVVRSVYKSIDAKRSATLYRQFPDALATIVRAVRVGIPVTEAIRAVSEDADFPTSIEFGYLHDQVGIGAPLEEALRQMAIRNHLPEYRFFATALALQSQTGGGLTETLENLADVVRKRVALKARGYALAAEARTSAAILALLPVFAGAALAVMSPSYIGPLLDEGPGQTLFGCGVLWLLLGILVMRGLIRKSLT